MARKSIEQLNSESMETKYFMNQNYSKANVLIKSSGRSTLLIQKIVALSIARATLNTSDNCMEAILYGTELKKIFGVEGGSFYEHIKAIIDSGPTKPSILSWRIIVNDDQKQEIYGMNVIIEASFKDGILKIRFNSRATPYLSDLKSNYTVLSIGQIMSLNSIYAFRLYEILKSEMDKQRAITKKPGPYFVQYNLTQLKLMLGIIDFQADTDLIKAVNSSSPNYEAIEAMADQIEGASKLKTYGNIKKFALDKAKVELNEKTSLMVDYEPVKAGRGGKVKDVRFSVNYKEAPAVHSDREKNEKSIDEEIANIEATQEIISEKLKMSELRAVLKAADYDMEKIKKAYALSRSARNISNLTGWLIEAIRKGYKTGANPYQINNYEQSDTNYDELEDLLLDN